MLQALISSWLAQSLKKIQKLPPKEIGFQQPSTP